MTLSQGFSEPFLPLSWRQSPYIEAPHFDTLALPRLDPLPQILCPPQCYWITFADLPFMTEIKTLHLCFQTYLQQQKIKQWVIRGVHPLFFESMSQPVHHLLTGREALLSLRHREHVHRPAIRELARRGRRHGRIHHVNLQKEYLQEPFVTAYQQLKKEVTHRYQVPLAHMYRRSLRQSDRLWFFVDHRPEGTQGKLLGAISIVQNGYATWHTEVLMRSPEAPVGIMEALIQQVFITLANEKQNYWSLGEVPFYPTAPSQRLKARAIVYTGQHIEFAYRARGLRHFKEKFKPFWRPVYLCGSPQLYWHDLARMFWSSHASQLVIHKAMQRFKRSS